MSNYQKRKTEVRQEAIDWQLDFANHNCTWGKLAYYGNYFGTLGKRYGLLREFRENGVI